MSRLAGPCLACPACGLLTINPYTPFLASQLVLTGSQLKYTPMPLAEQQIGDLTVELRTTFLTKLKLHSLSFHSLLLSLGEGVLISEVKCAKPQSHYRWWNRNHFSTARQMYVRSWYWKSKATFNRIRSRFTSGNTSSVLLLFAQVRTSWSILYAKPLLHHFLNHAAPFAHALQYLQVVCSCKRLTDKITSNKGAHKTTSTWISVGRHWASAAKTTLIHWGKDTGSQGVSCGCTGILAASSLG